jgi:hypothetical protein
MMVTGTVNGFGACELVPDLVIAAALAQKGATRFEEDFPDSLP